MTSSSNDDISQFEIHKRTLSEIQRSNNYLSEILQQLARANKTLADLQYLVNGFTSEGSSFQAHQVDQFTSAYIAVLGPLVARRMAQDPMPLPEMMKGAAVLAKQFLEELAAYRSERSGLDLLEDMAAGLRDPFKEETP